MQGSHWSSLTNSIDFVTLWLSDGQGKVKIRLGLHKNRIISNDCSLLSIKIYKEDTTGQERLNRMNPDDWVTASLSRQTNCIVVYCLTSRQQKTSRQVVYCLTSPRLTWHACSRWTQTCHLAICWARISLQWNGESNSQKTHFFCKLVSIVHHIALTLFALM